MPGDDEYYFKDYQPRRGTDLVVEVAKFNGRTRPEAVYTVSRHSSRWTCDCAAGYRGACKHVRMVEEWVRAGRPSPFERWEER